MGEFYKNVNFVSGLTSKKCKFFLGRDNKMLTLIAYTLISCTMPTRKPKLAKEYAIANADFADTKKLNLFKTEKRND